MFIADISELDERTLEVTISSKANRLWLTTKACIVWVCNRTGVFYAFLWRGEGKGPLEVGVDPAKEDWWDRLRRSIIYELYNYTARWWLRGMGSSTEIGLQQQNMAALLAGWTFTRRYILAMHEPCPHYFTTCCSFGPLPVMSRLYHHLWNDNPIDDH